MAIKASNPANQVYASGIKPNHELINTPIPANTKAAEGFHNPMQDNMRIISIARNAPDLPQSELDDAKLLS
jgi:hypothetical protein